MELPPQAKYALCPEGSIGIHQSVWHSPEHFSCSLHMWLKGFLELEQHFQHPLAFRRFLSAVPKFFLEFWWVKLKEKVNIIYGRDNFPLSVLAQTWITHVKISQLVASLQTSCEQVVFALLVTSCQQVWNKLLTTCNKLVDIVRLVTRLFQQGCYNHDITILLQPCNILVISWLYQTC